MTDQKKYKTFVYYSFYYISLILLLQLIIYGFNIPNYLFPAPIVILKTFFHSFHYLFSNGIITIFETVGGLVLASIIGIILGALFIYYSFAYRLFYPFILIFQMLPIVAIGPIIIIWFGFGMMSKLMVVMFISLYPILSSFLQGVKEIPFELREWMTLIRATRFQTFRYLVFPSCFGSFFAGLKIATTYSITASIVAEFLGAEKGLGISLSKAISSYNTGLLFAVVLFIVMSTLILYQSVSYLEFKIRPYRKEGFQ